MSGLGSAPHVWQPSIARRIVLDGFLPLPRGTIPATPAYFSWPAKDPGDTLDYEIDISQALAGNDNDAVATVTATVAPIDTLVVGQIACDGPSGVIWLSGGQAGTTYSVQLVITTLTGRVIARTVLLPVQSLAPATVPPPSTAGLTAQNGLSISDNSGAAILVSA